LDALQTQVAPCRRGAAEIHRFAIAGEQQAWLHFSDQADAIDVQPALSLLQHHGHRRFPPLVDAIAPQPGLPMGRVR
ncbi:hypothetical protein HMPREF0293_2003, partial [Corynebacterium glucuronolyticum ATCC 51866]